MLGLEDLGGLLKTIFHTYWYIHIVIVLNLNTRHAVISSLQSLRWLTAPSYLAKFERYLNLIHLPSSFWTMYIFLSHRLDQLSADQQNSHLDQCYRRRGQDNPER